MDIYEKKYKEALKWIESIYPYLSHEHQMEAEAFFLELAESEDEKMIHQLHSWMKEFGGAEEYTEKVYQWIKGLLEKQGQPTDNDMVEALRTEYEKGRADAFTQMQKEWSEEDKKIRNEIINFLRSPFVNDAICDWKIDPWVSWLEKQGMFPMCKE